MNLNEEVGLSPETLTLLLDYSGLTVYMTRGALRDLGNKLKAISDAPPEENFEIHLRLESSRMDQDGNVAVPPFKSVGGIGTIVQQLHEAAVKEAIDKGELTSKWSASSFELTFMHISPDQIQEAAEWPDET